MGGLLTAAWRAVVAVSLALRRPFSGRAAWPRLAGLALTGGFVAMLLALWNPVFRFTGLLHLDAAREATMLPALRGQPIALSPSGGYDGQYYAQVACDPTLRTLELRTAIDALPYRAQRILVPAVAWVLGGGRPGMVVQVYSVLNVACWLVLAVLLWRLLGADQWRGLAAWAGVMFSAGALASVGYSLTDLPALLLFVAAMLAVERSRPRSALAWFAASLLARETMLVGGWGLLPKAWESPSRLWRAGAKLGLAVLPLALWLLYIRWQVGASGPGARNFAWPGLGLIEEWGEELAHVRTEPNHWLAYSSLLATAGLTLQVVFMVIHFRPADRWWRAGFGYVLLMLVLGTAVWEGFSGAALRVLLPLLLVCNVLVLRSHRSSWWLLAINLSLVSGIVDMRQAPQLDYRELAAARREDSAAVLRLGGGCYGLEKAGRVRWTWTAQEAGLELQMWAGREPVEVELTLGLSAVARRNLVILAGGNELWRGEVGLKSARVILPPIRLQGGRLQLQLLADAPGVREPSGADRRALSVCVANPRLRVLPRAAAPQ